MTKHPTCHLPFELQINAFVDALLVRKILFQLHQPRKPLTLSFNDKGSSCCYCPWEQRLHVYVDGSEKQLLISLKSAIYCYVYHIRATEYEGDGLLPAQKRKLFRSIHAQLKQQVEEQGLESSYILEIKKQMLTAHLDFHMRLHQQMLSLHLSYCLRNESNGFHLLISLSKNRVFDIILREEKREAMLERLPNLIHMVRMQMATIGNYPLSIRSGGEEIAWHSSE